MGDKPWEWVLLILQLLLWLRKDHVKYLCIIQSEQVIHAIAVDLESENIEPGETRCTTSNGSMRRQRKKGGEEEEK